jgi:hypothetical protein
MKVELGLGGLTTRTSEPSGIHFTWLNQELKVGDEVTVQVIESETADEPLKPDEEAIARSMRHNKDLERKRFESCKRFYLANRHKYEG